MHDVSGDLFKVFIDETREQLESMINALVQFDKNKSDNEIINKIFRISHTMKGSSAAMNFMKMSGLTHRMEDVLHSIRDGKLQADDLLVEILFVCHDFLSNSLEYIEKNSTEDEEQYKNIDSVMARLTSLTSSEAMEAGRDDTIEAKYEAELKKVKDTPFSPENDMTSHVTGEIENVIKRIRINSHTVENDSEEKEIIHLLYRDFHTIRSLGAFINKASIKRVALCAEELVDALMKTNTAADDALVAILCTGCDLCEKINKEPDDHRLKSEIEDFESSVAKYRESINTSNKANKSVSADHSEGFIRISKQKIAKLNEMIEEILINQYRMKQKWEKRFGVADPIMSSISKITRLARSMHNITLSMKTVPVKNTLLRIVREGQETAISHSRDIKISLASNDFEVEKNIEELIYSSALYLINLIISRELETGNRDTTATNRTQTHILIKTSLEKTRLLIKIFSDDYRIKDGTALEHMPGIPMIKASYETLEDSEYAYAFTVNIPLNPPVIDGIMVAVSNANYIIPTCFIRQIIKPDKSQWIMQDLGNPMLKLQDKIIEVTSNNCIAGAGNPQTLENNIAVLLEMNGKLLVLPVDKVLEKKEYVVKQLGEKFSGLDYDMKASVSTDEGVPIVLDNEALLCL